jgi:hypothetical protein
VVGVGGNHGACKCQKETAEQRYWARVSMQHFPGGVRGRVCSADQSPTWRHVQMQQPAGRRPPAALHPSLAFPLMALGALPSPPQSPISRPPTRPPGIAVRPAGEAAAMLTPLPTSVGGAGAGCSKIRTCVLSCCEQGCTCGCDSGCPLVKTPQGFHTQQTGRLAGRQGGRGEARLALGRGWLGRRGQEGRRVATERPLRPFT